MLRKRLINPSKVDWTDYNCNHYSGCAHNCQYPCYAKKFSRMKEGEWVHPIPVKNAMELAAKEIKKIPRHSCIMVSSMSDPYQPLEADLKLTRSLIPILASREDVKVILITKSDLVMRDFELIKEYPNVALCMTITATKNIPQYEPNAPGNPARIKCLRLAKEAGIYTIASIEPWIPKVTKPLEVVELIYPHVKGVIIGSWNWHYSQHSEAFKKAVQIYRAKLPLVIDFLQARMIRVFVKKELRELVPLERDQSSMFEYCVAKAKEL